MGFSLKRLGKNIADVFQANSQDDQKRRIAAGQPRLYQDQQRAAAKPQASRGRTTGTKIWDQVNIFDNNRTYRQAAPTNQRSVVGQIGGAPTAVYRYTKKPRQALNMAVGAAGYGVELGNMARESVFGTDQSYQRAVKTGTERLKRYDAGNGAFGDGYLPSFKGDRLKESFIKDPQKIREVVATGADIAQYVPVAKGFQLGTGTLKQLPKVVLQNSAEGGITSGVGSITRQLAETGRVDAKQTLIDTTTGAAMSGASPVIGKTFSSGSKELSKGVSDYINVPKTPKVTVTKTNPNVELKAQLKTVESNIDALRKTPASREGETALRQARREQAALKDQIKKSRQKGGNSPDNSPTIKNIYGEDVPNPSYVKPKVGNLDESLNMDKYRQRAANPIASEAPVDPLVSTRGQVAKLTDAQVSKQMVEDLGISKAAADRLIKLNGKVDTTARLYGAKDLIRGADNPDAYATGIINKVRADGQAALNQNMPPVKPKVKAKGDFVEMPDANGNIIRIPRSEWDAEAGLPKQFTEKPTAPKPGTDQFAEGVDDLPTKPKITAKATEESVFDQRLKEAYAKANKEWDAIEGNLGYKPDEIRQKMIQQSRGEYQMTPRELKASQMYTDRLNAARATAEQDGVVIAGNQEVYTPQVSKSRSLEIKNRDDLLDFGYSKKRTDAIPLEDMNYGRDPQIDYVVKAENRALVMQKAIDDAARVDGRVVTPKKVEAAAQTLNDLHKKIQGSAQKGKISTNDSLEMLHRMGKDEGYTQVRNDFKPSIIDQSPQAMMEKAGVFRNGFEQFDNSTGYASELVTLINQNKIPRQQIPAAFEKFVRSRLPDAEPSSVANASRYISRRLDVGGATDEGMTALFDRGFKNVAKSEMLKLGKTTQFSSKKMRAVINEQINGRAFIDANNKNLGQNLDSFVSERVNVSLRGANVVSALFELGDEANIGAKYGYSNLDYVLAKVDGDRFHYSKKYGEAGAHFLSDDIPQVTKMNEIMSNPDWSMARKTYELYRNVENKVLLFRYIEEYKTEQFFRAAEKHYRGKGLQGGELVDRVMSDFNTTLLPHKLATATRVLGKAPKSLSQYLNWSIQATKRMGRTLSGSDTGGKFADMTRGGRIARGVSTELVPKVLSAALLGVPIMQVMGMRDFTGATQGDFTGIPDEDKNALDQLVGVLNLSPITGMGSNYYYANRRNQLADQNKAEGEDYKAERDPNDTIAGVTKKNAEMLIPFKTQYNKTKQVVDAKKKGYYESRDGRVQTEAPQGAEYLASLITGKSYSPTMRDYQDNPSALSVIQGKAKPIDLLKKNQSVSNFNQAIGGKPTTNYKRPLTKTYSDAYKEADKAMRTSLLDGGRKYNKTLDDLKRNNPDAYNSYIRAMDDHVSPEYWREITGGSSKKGADLTIFNMSKARKKQLLSDMNKAGKNKDGKYNYDPLYDLPDDQARIVLQQKATITGDDLALRNILYKEKWYQNYMDKQSAYYDKKPAGDDEFKTTQRQKEWNKYNDEYNSLTGVKNDRLKKDYPLVYQLKQYKYGSPESKAFLKNNYAAWKAQSDKLDKQKLIAINKMRKIEGAEPMSENAYAQATEFADTDPSDDKKYTKWGNGGGSTASSYSGKSLTSVKGKVAAPKLSVKAPVKLKGDSKAVAIGKPKVTIKKALT